MEAAVRSYLHTMLADYVTGLNNTEITLPLTLRNLQLKAEAVNKELEDVPFNLIEGNIGFVSLKPNTTFGLPDGTFEVICSDVRLNLSYSMTKFMKNMMGGNEEEGYYEPSMPGSPQHVRQQQQPRPPPENVAPCYCKNHDTSAKRQKSPDGPFSVRCETCNVEFQTTYIGARLCQYCSNSQGRCIICGESGAASSGYIPATKARPVDDRSGPGDRGPNPGDHGPGACGGDHYSRDNRQTSFRGGPARRGPEGDLPPPPPPAPGLRGGEPDRSVSQRYGQDGAREQRYNHSGGREQGPDGPDPYATRGPQASPRNGGAGNVYGPPPPGPGGPPANGNPQRPGQDMSFSQQGAQHQTRWNPGPGPTGPPRRTSRDSLDDDSDDETFVGFLKGIFDFRGGTCSKPNAVDSIDVYHNDDMADPRGYSGGMQGGYR